MVLNAMFDTYPMGNVMLTQDATGLVADDISRALALSIKSKVHDYKLEVMHPFDCKACTF